MRANSVMEYSFDGTTMRFDFSDGGHVELNVTEARKTTGDYAAVHGYRQRLQDATAIIRDPKTGKSATVAKKRAAMQRVADALKAGTWGVTREGGGTDSGLLFRALQKYFAGKKTDDEIRASIKGKSAEDRRKLLGAKKLQKIVSEIRSEGGNAEAGDAMLAEMSS